MYKWNNRIQEWLDIINAAIEDKKKIRFFYNALGTDFKLHLKRQEPYIVSPYKAISVNEKLYLIGSIEEYDDIVNFRLDKMTDVECLEEISRDINDNLAFYKALSCPIHMAEKIYMFSGESVWAEIKTTSDMMWALTDWFETNFLITEESDESIVVLLKCNYSALRHWVLQYGPYVEILSPLTLRDQIKIDVQGMWEKYK
ncbi:WYL domain-containing protein [Anaerovibrio lipolyticus]|uniref:WYL domain-containing protein n=1 Tax=Anaerovibrio lipolyticus TaxID=82374 RepID=UPI0023F289BC|nr:WYL domain-containing protein [Anaerovibrio lipolyticus]